MSESQITLAKSPQDLTNFLMKGRSAIEMALPKHLNPDRMLRLAVTCWSTTPALRNCTPTSILGAIVVASQLGLEPGIAGQAYLIPYKNTCTLVPGWQGLVGLLNNSGRATAWTGAVYEGDVWDFQLGSNPKCIHIPGDNYGDADKITWVYACGQVNGSQLPVIEAWPMSRVWKHRDRYNKVGSKHYSYQHPEMYARKVVLLQVLKYMPRSIELNNAITAADSAELGRVPEVQGGVIIDIEPQEQTPSTQEMVGKVARRPSEGSAAQSADAGVNSPAEVTASDEGSTPSAPTDARDLGKLAEIDEIEAILETEEVLLKPFMAAVVAFYPNISTTAKLLSDLNPDMLKAIQKDMPELLSRAKEIAARMAKRPTS